MLDEKINKACSLIKSSKKTMVLTGAGASTESGIPDFRSPGTGLWEKLDPMEVLSTNAFYDNPERFYREGFGILLDMAHARPNRVHNILAEMERLGFIQGIITQNIDNLHHLAGSQYILEVHGNTREGICVNCEEIIKINLLIEKLNLGELPPKCNKCRGIIKPNVVLFGDMLPEDFNIAMWEVETSDLLIVIGSSLAVAPVNHLPQVAKQLIIINEGHTFMDEFCNVKLKGNAGDILEKILENLER